LSITRREKSAPFYMYKMSTFWNVLISNEYIWKFQKDSHPLLQACRRKVGAEVA
jgi:hypothetical protein